MEISWAGQFGKWVGHTLDGGPEFETHVEPSFLCIPSLWQEMQIRIHQVENQSYSNLVHTTCIDVTCSGLWNAASSTAQLQF